MRTSERDRRLWWMGWLCGLWAIALLRAGQPALAEEGVENGEPPDEPVPTAVEPEDAAVPEDVANPPLVKEGDDAAYDEIRLFTEALLHIRRQYVEEKTYKEIVQGGLRGLLQSLDPHSDFLDADAYRSLQEDAASKFSGIGISIGMREGLLTVIAPMEDTPAFRAGVLAGDTIVAIDGRKTQGMTLREAVKRLRGPRGEAVTVTVRRAGDESEHVFVLVRADIFVASVKGARMVRDGIGYVRLTQFSEPTAEALAETLAQLANDGARALVLDLRNNHGGLLRSAVEVAQLFLPRQTVIVTTKGREGVHRETRAVARGRVRYLEWPMATLINGGSASAAEIVAGALQDHRRAVIVGETSFGKASVQSLIALKADESTAIRLTVGRYYTPNGRAIHGKGIDPDIEVKLTPAQWRETLTRRAHLEDPDLFSQEEIAAYEHATDPPLERAADILQGVLVLGR